MRSPRRPTLHCPRARRRARGGFLNSLREVFGLLNHLRSARVIEDYAIGGAMAALFYAEPARTYDVDVFVVLPASPESTLRPLGALYSWLGQQGFRPDAEHVLIHGVPVQFLPAFNPLVDEALRDARVLEYDGVPVRVVGPEHLCALAIQAGGRKRRERAWQLLESGTVDRQRLIDVLQRHGLPGEEFV